MRKIRSIWLLKAYQICIGARVGRFLNRFRDWQSFWGVFLAALIGFGALWFQSHLQHHDERLQWRREASGLRSILRVELSQFADSCKTNANLARAPSGSNHEVVVTMLPYDSLYDRFYIGLPSLNPTEISDFFETMLSYKDMRTETLKGIGFAEHGDIFSSTNTMAEAKAAGQFDTCAISALRIVEAFDVAEAGDLCFRLGRELLAREQLAFKGREKALAHGVVVSVADGPH